MLYSCKEADGNQEQLKLVRRFCENKEECRIDVTRYFFGNFECPETHAGNMKLWLVYSCAGGGNDVTKINAPVCDGDDLGTPPTTPLTQQTPPTTPSTQPTPATTQSSCVPLQGKTGFMVRLDIGSREGELMTVIG